MCAAANIWCIIYNTGMLVVDYISINEWTSTKYHMRFVSKKWMEYSPGSLLVLRSDNF